MLERKPRPLSLSPRLLKAASLVRPSDRFLDIGTDHARLPVYLTERGLCAKASATDCKPGPLERAKQTIKAHMLEGEISLHLTDGARGLCPSDYDTVAITGMGGETILEILAQSPWILQKRLIISPQTKIHLFTDYSEKFEVHEKHRKYTVFLYEEVR